MGRRTDPTPAAPATSLPVELSSFVGREAEVSQLASLLEGVRLLTLTGAGGSGKTRLALEVARRSRPGRVVWSGLASLDDPSLLRAHVAASAGVEAEPAGVAELAGILGSGPLLLVLDNCEHLVEACAELAEGLLRATPALSILATSREALGVRGERAWLVPPLDLPEEGVGPDVAGTAASVRLFVERAREVVAGFTLTDANAGAVAEICRALDGIPLAIELAAARVRVLSPGQIRERLGGALDLLQAGGRGVLPRHRTLRAAIDWSHELLRPEARRLLRRLAVFRGGATLEAAEAVGRGEGDADVLELLTVLVDRSLVAARAQEESVRYALLETMRQYGLERLEEAGEADQARRRHARHFGELAARAEPHLTDVGRPVWVARLLPELDNLREALHWTRDHDPREHALLVGRLWWFWYSTRHWAEAEGWLDGALALPEAAEAAVRAPLLFARGALPALQGRGAEARPFLEEAVERAAHEGNGRLEAYARNYLGLGYIGEGRPEGGYLCREAEAWFREHGDLYGLRLALLLQGSLARLRGDTAEALRLNREGVEVARRFGLDRELATSLQNLASVHVGLGEHADAERLLREALARSRRDPSHFFAATGLAYLAEALGHQGRVLEAARLLGAAEGVAAVVGYRFFPMDRKRMEEALVAFRAAGGEEAFEAERAAGRRLTLDEALAEVAELPGATSDAGLGGAAAHAPAGGPPGVDRGRPSPPGQGCRGVADLEVRLLGTFQVRARGRDVPPERWSYAKPRELLALLALRPEGATRDRLAEQLWPGSPPDAWKNRFHVTLHHLRKALGEGEWIVLDGERYRVAPGLSLAVDARAFEEEARAALDSHAREAGDAGSRIASLRRALALCGGELLEGERPGEELEACRDRLRGLELQCHLELARLWEEVGDVPAALAAYGGAAGREPLSEEAHRGLMRGWAASGERARALAHYERVRALLRDRLGVEPDPETEALARSLEAAGS